MKHARLAGGIFLALVLLLLALPWFISAEKFRPLIARQLQAATGRPVQFGELSLSLFPPSLSAASLDIKGLATAESLSVRVRVLPLLTGDIEIASLRLIRPVITYAAAPAASGAAPAIPTIGSLEIVDGVLHYTNAAGQRSEYNDIDASLSASPAELHGELSWKNATLPVDLHFAAKRAGAVWNFSRLDVKSGSITAGFTGSIDTAAATVDGNLAIQPTPLDGLPLKSPYKPRGTVTAQVRLAGPYANPALTGAVQLKNLEVTGGKLTHPLRADSVQLDLTPTRITARPFALQAGPTPIQLAFQLDGYTGAAPSLDANISARDAAVQDLLVLAQFHDYAGSGQASFQIRATGPLARLAYSGAVELKSLEVSGGKLTQPLRAAALQLDLTPTRITARPFTLNAGPAVIQARFQLDDYAAKPRIDADSPPATPPSRTSSPSPVSTASLAPAASPSNSTPPGLPPTPISPATDRSPPPRSTSPPSSPSSRSTPPASASRPPAHPLRTPPSTSASPTSAAPSASRISSIPASPSPSRPINSHPPNSNPGSRPPSPPPLRILPSPSPVTSPPAVSSSAISSSPTSAPTSPWPTASSPSTA
jgi:hypothetical protein